MLKAPFTIIYCQLSKRSAVFFFLSILMKTITAYGIETTTSHVSYYQIYIFGWATALRLLFAYVCVCVLF